MNPNIPPIQHLLRQVELYKRRRERRDHRPEWISQFIDVAIDFFDPDSDIARVGFDCTFDEDHWRVGLFLGRTEMIGGRDDGKTHDANFEFDVLGLTGLFDSVSNISLVARPDIVACEDVSAHGTWISVSGIYIGEKLTTDVQASAPDQAGPGFRMFPNGLKQPV